MAAKIEVIIVFKDEVPIVFRHNEELVMMTLKGFHGEADGDIHVEVNDLKQDGKAVYLTLYSDRTVNGLWQQDLLLDYLKAEHAGKLEEFHTTVWTSLDDRDYFLMADDDDF